MLTVASILFAGIFYREMFAHEMLVCGLSNFDGSLSGLWILFAYVDYLC